MSPIATHGATTADRREGGTWGRAQRIKNGILYVLASAAVAIFGLLPSPMLRALGGTIGRLGYLAFGRARRTAHSNIARALPAMGATSRSVLVRRCYVHLGRHLGDAVDLLCGGRLTPLELDPGAQAVLAAALAESRGVVFASAHLGPWERVAGSLVHAGFPLTTVARQAYDPRLTALYDRLRGSLGVQVVYRELPGASLRLLRVLKDGRLLGLPMDLRSRVPSVDAQFLGHAAPTAIGPARLALRAGAAVVVGTVARDAAGKLFISATRIETGDLTKTRRDELVLTRRINDELSSRILALPDEWVWMHSRWAGDAVDGS